MENTRFDKDILKTALGSGIRYPSMFSEAKGVTLVQEGLDKVRQSIADILETRLGERVMKPEYGSRLHEVVFEPNDFIAQDKAKLYIQEALDRWEDRIVVETIETSIPNNASHRMEIKINYKLNRSNIEDTYIYLLTGEGGS